MLSPGLARRQVTDMVTHPTRTWRKNSDICAAFALQLELRTCDAFAQLIIADADRAFCRLMICIYCEISLLLISILPEFSGRSRVMTVTMSALGEHPMKIANALKGKRKTVEVI